jgi:hypothetical protein
LSVLLADAAVLPPRREVALSAFLVGVVLHIGAGGGGKEAAEPHRDRTCRDRSLRIVISLQCGRNGASRPMAATLKEVP